MKLYLHEVEAILWATPRRVSKQNPEAYIGGGQSKLRYLGLRVPDLRKVHSEGFSFSQKPLSEVSEIWDFIWSNSDCFEVMCLALIWFSDKKQIQSLKTHWPVLKKWSLKIDNWAHADALSAIYARIHEEAPTTAYLTFKKWNLSKNPWLRRLSIVSLFYYSSQRKHPPPLHKVTFLLKPQLKYPHYYVQKGVGWTLREAWNVYPKPVYAFVEKNIHDISAIAFSAATEKMPLHTREHLKRIRKNSRK
jgi:3-methyladenine DNA glycosylase AlkD